MGRRVLVTGTAGRVGRRVAAALAAGGDDVLGVDARAGRPLPGVEQRVVRLEVPGAATACLDGVDAIVHLAALMSWDPADAGALYAANVTATFELLEGAARSSVRRVVFASSGEVYPESAPQFLPITEDHPRRPTTRYGMTKLLGEELVAAYGRGGLETVVVRLEHTQEAGELLDPGSFFSGPRFFLQPRIARERRLGNAAMAELLTRHGGTDERLLLLRDPAGRASTMPIADARDIAKGILLALDVGTPGLVVGLGPAEPVRFAEALPRMAALTGLPIAEIPVPGPLPCYEVAIDRAREAIGYRPAWTFDAMLDEAAGRVPAAAGGPDPDRSARPPVGRRQSGR